MKKMIWVGLVALGLLSGCTVCTANRVFPKVAWAWSRDAQLERASRAEQRAYEESLKGQRK